MRFHRVQNTAKPSHDEAIGSRINGDMTNCAIEDFVECWPGNDEPQACRYHQIFFVRCARLSREMRQTGGKFVNSIDGGKRVIDSRGKGPHHYIGQLLKLVADILSRRSLTAQQECAEDALLNLIPKEK